MPALQQKWTRNPGCLCSAFYLSTVCSSTLLISSDHPRFSLHLRTHCELRHTTGQHRLPQNKHFQSKCGSLTVAAQLHGKNGQEILMGFCCAFYLPTVRTLIRPPFTVPVSLHPRFFLALTHTSRGSRTWDTRNSTAQGRGRLDLTSWNWIIYICDNQLFMEEKYRAVIVETCSSVPLVLLLL